MLEAVAQCTPPPPPPAAAAGDASCTATAGGLGPAVPWSRHRGSCLCGCTTSAPHYRGSELSLCLAGNVAVAFGTITISNPGDLRIECGRSFVSGASSAEAELCGMVDRLEAHHAAATHMLVVGLLFQDLTSNPSGAILLRGGSGANATVVRCTFRRNSAGSGEVRQPPQTPSSSGSRVLPCAADAG